MCLHRTGEGALCAPFESPAMRGLSCQQAGKLSPPNPGPALMGDTARARRTAIADLKGVQCLPDTEHVEIRPPASQLAVLPRLGIPSLARPDPELNRTLTRLLVGLDGRRTLDLDRDAGTVRRSYRSYSTRGDWCRPIAAATRNSASIPRAVLSMRLEPDQRQ